jgi:putative transposase
VDFCHVCLNLEQLDLLLIQEVRARKVRRDGIRFQSLRYLSLTLAAYGAKK